MRWRVAFAARSQGGYFGLLLLLLTALLTEPLAARTFDSSPWILVDGSAAELRVMRGPEPIEIVSNISVGRGGVGYKSRLGDEITPTGSFRIAWINRNSPYYLFFGFDYPTLLYAERARQRSSVTDDEYRRIVAAHDAGRIPPQTTSLGGQLGIHGIGRGDPEIHSRFNWTAGCVALTDHQIDRLSRWLRVGTLVVIAR